jgi:hypothetical protein
LKAKWVIEVLNDIEDTERLITSLEGYSTEYKRIKYIPFSDENYDIYPEEDCVIFYGSLNLAAQLKRKKKWVPGVYCNLDNMKCSTYYSHFGKYLLNSDYTMLPIMEFQRRKEELFKQYGVDNHIFLRPDVGNKILNGEVWSIDDVNVEKKALIRYFNGDLDKVLVVISSPKIIDCEWRYVIVDREVVTWSQYKENGRISKSPYGNIKALTLADNIAKEEWQPDICYTVDIAKSNDEIRLLEINSFSCSGLYDCDMDLIVKEVSKAAEKEWDEYFKEID